jgi:putative hydrolase of the HAD superfamily
VSDLRAVIFDFGGVFTVSPFTAAREGGLELGIAVEEALELCFGSYAEDTDHPWHRLERGEVGLGDAHRDLIALAAERGLDLDPLSMLMRLTRDDDQREEVVDRALKIRDAGFRTACLTNNVLEFGDHWKAMIPVDDLFEVVIDSCHTGVRKPNPAMYHQALQALEVEPHEAVFLDDFPANVAAAEAVGMRGIVVGDDRLAAFEELEALLWGR